MATALPAPALYALSCQAKIEGPDTCHWCGSPCKRIWKHDGAPSLLFTKDLQRPRYPASAYICMGCWLFRRRAITIWYLGEDRFKDRQAPQEHSWWITDKGSWVVSPDNAMALQTVLLKPPRKFALALLSGDAPSVKNLLHLNNANDLPAIQEDTPLHFTVDNVPMLYTTYELKEALKYGPDGKEAGVRYLYKLFGSPPPIPPEPAGKKSGGSGRPPALKDGRETKKFVTASGS